MASIINASTSGAGGVITTADASGVLQIQTAGTAAVTVDASQSVGVGTTTPSSWTNAKLVIQSSASASSLVIDSLVYPTAQTFGIDFTVGSGSKQAFVKPVIENGTTAATALTFGTSAVGNGATERARIDSSGYLSGTVNSLGKGLYQAQQYYRLDSGLAGANVNTAQSIFGVGVTLAGSTVYEFEMVCPLLKSAGTTSHTISLGFGGTATINNCAYTLINAWSSSGISTTSNGANAMTILTASSTVVTAAFTGAGEGVNFIIKGTVSINAGGTFIPQYTLSAAPGGAYTTQAGSYIKISPISASGANTNIGTWA